MRGEYPTDFATAARVDQSQPIARDHMAKRTPRTEARDRGLAAPPPPMRDAAPQPSINERRAARAAASPTEEEIRLRAYHRYLERGGGHGMDFEDWLEAERELTRQS